ncbi:MAG: TlpA disulfide reductase family protein [Bacteroidota bacterium]
MGKFFKYTFAFILIFGGTLLNTNAQKLNHLKGTAFPKEVKEVKLYTESGEILEFKKVLKKLKGSVIYLDFWASWCGPCIREMPHSKNVQKYFKDKNVAFLYLSTDIEQEKWLRGLKRININGSHYRIDPESKALFKKLFKIPGIPYYVIIDEKGNIAEPKARWPREENLLKDIDKTLRN